MQRRDAVLRAIRDHPISQRRIGVLLERVGMIMNEKKALPDYRAHSGVIRSGIPI
jgi:hypothetical protein